MKSFLSKYHSQNLGKLAIGSIFLLLTSPEVFALSPIVQYQDLVAGEGESGYADGPFYLAQFNHPIGLTVSSDGSTLYVADEGNNLIRTVLLNKKNTVHTLAGTGKAGKKDGPLSIASFNQPSALALLPNDQIAVIDQGNSSIRLIDLKTKRVTTLAGKNSLGTPTSQTVNRSSHNFWGITYLPSDNGLYFSQPELGTLKRLDLKTLQIKTILKNNSSVPNPSAICAFENKLFLADQFLPGVYEVQPTKKETLLVPAQNAEQPASPISSDKTERTLAPSQNSPSRARKANLPHNVLSLAVSGKSLYALQADAKAPILRIFPGPKTVHFITAWPGGNTFIRDPGTLLPNFRGAVPGTMEGFTADPKSMGRFFVVNTSLSIISSFRDLDFTTDPNHLNQGGLKDFEYPFAKPPGTFRILLISSSHPLQISRYPSWFKHFPEGENKTAALAKRMELALNTTACLDDSNFHYEVLDGSKVNRQDLYIWPYYTVPSIARKYDIDLVVILMHPFTDLYSYFEAPLGVNGIPSNHLDPEFNLERNSDKFKSGELHDFFNLCKDRGVIQVASNGRWVIPEFNRFTSDPKVRASLIGIIGKPLGLLREKLGALKSTGGQNCRLLFCFFPTGDVFNNIRFPTKNQRFFWKDLCEKKNIEFLDLCDSFAALRLTYFPFSDGIGNDHFYLNGHELMATILSHDLLKQKLIPFGSPDSKDQKSGF